MSKAKNYERILIQHVHDGTFSIDEEGRVWRHYMLGCGVRRTRLRIPTRRAEVPAFKGYLRIKFKVDGRKVSVFAHRLVWQFFRGDIPDDLEPNHKDGIKSNNHPDNLELTTSSGNTTHAYRVLGSLDHKGEKHPKHILTEAQVRWIKERCANYHYGLDAELARRFGVVSQTIRHIRIGKNWANIT